MLKKTELLSSMYHRYFDCKLVCIYRNKLKPENNELTHFLNLSESARFRNGYATESLHVTGVLLVNVV